MHSTGDFEASELIWSNELADSVQINRWIQPIVIDRWNSIGQFDSELELLEFWNWIEILQHWSWLDQMHRPIQCKLIVKLSWFNPLNWSISSIRQFKIGPNQPQSTGSMTLQVQYDNSVRSFSGIKMNSATIKAKDWSHGLDWIHGGCIWIGSLFNGLNSGEEFHHETMQWWSIAMKCHEMFIISSVAFI